MSAELEKDEEETRQAVCSTDLLYANAPDEVPYYYEYENHVKTAYYSLELPYVTVDRVELWGIEQALTELEEDDLNDTTICYWTPTQHGWKVNWRLPGSEFLKRSKPMEKK